MALSNISNYAYLMLVALAKKGSVQRASIREQTVYFAQPEAEATLRLIGIHPKPVGDRVRSLVGNGELPSDYTLTYSVQDVRAAITKAGTNLDAPLVASVDVNTPALSSSGIATGKKHGITA